MPPTPESRSSHFVPRRWLFYHNDNFERQEPESLPKVWCGRFRPDQEILMQHKLIVPAVVAAALLGAPVIATAQSDTQGGPAASTEAKPMKHHKMRTSHHMKAGTTTGLSTRSRPGSQPVSRKQPGS
jgi:hypothetical protein